MEKYWITSRSSAFKMFLIKQVSAVMYSRYQSTHCGKKGKNGKKREKKELRKYRGKVEGRAEGKK